jgi:dynein heavy chain 2, cytosolic
MQPNGGPTLYFSQAIFSSSTETRVDCFIVNLSPLRSDIEFISRRYWEALSMTLRASILADINYLQDYLTSALQVLRHIPQDESKIIEASAKYEKIVQDLPKMADVLKNVQEKDTCLAGWCKERVSSLMSIQSQWEQLQPLVENHQSLLQGRLDIFKNEVLNKVFTLGEESEKFLIRWQTTLQELESNDEADINIFKDRLQQWDVILEKKAQMM